MYRTFNMGIGMIMVVSPDDADAVIANLKGRGEAVYTIGEITEDQGVPVVMKGSEFSA